MHDVVAFFDSFKCCAQGLDEARQFTSPILWPFRVFFRDCPGQKGGARVSKLARFDAFIKGMIHSSDLPEVLELKRLQRVLCWQHTLRGRAIHVGNVWP
jgi:hypothetical protein